MIGIEKISELNDSEESKILIAAIAILTSLDEKDLDDEIWGGTVHPDDALKRVVELANKIYFFEELEAEKKLSERQEKINKIIK